MSDNTSAVTCIGQMGICHSKANNSLIIQIWEWCIAHDVWITMAHIPGKENIQADWESRKSWKETEWALNKSLFRAAIKKLKVTPDIDLFASRLNYQIQPFVSYKPDPEAYICYKYLPYILESLHILCIHNI